MDSLSNNSNEFIYYSMSLLVYLFIRFFIPISSCNSYS